MLVLEKRLQGILGGFVHGELSAAEALARSFYSVDSFPKPGREIVGPPAVEPDSFIRWGARSSFQFNTFREDARLFKGIRLDDTNRDPEPLKRVRITYAEEGREWKDIRVHHHDDPDQYLVVREPSTVSLAGPAGQFLVSIGTESVGPTLAKDQDPKYPPPLEQLNENTDWLDWNARHHFG